MTISPLVLLPATPTSEFVDLRAPNPILTFNVNGEIVAINLSELRLDRFNPLTRPLKDGYTLLIKRGDKNDDGLTAVTVQLVADVRNGNNLMI